jgi:hypothetical protein
MTRELRQATTLTVYDGGTAVAGTTPSGDQILADFAGGKRVSYQCDITSGALKQCTRKQGLTATAASTFFGTAGSGYAKVVDSISNGTTKVFSKPVATDKYFSITIKVKSNGNVKSTAAGHIITFSDGFFARNT